MYWKQLSHFYRLEPFSFQISRNISTDRQSRDGIFTATQSFDFLFHRFFLCVSGVKYWTPNEMSVGPDEILLSHCTKWRRVRATRSDGFTLMKPKKRDERESSDNQGGDVGQRGSKVQSRSILYNLACVYVCNTVGRIGSTWMHPRLYIYAVEGSLSCRRPWFCYTVGWFTTR